MYACIHARAHGFAYPPSPLSLPLALAPSHPHPPRYPPLSRAHAPPCALTARKLHVHAPRRALALPAPCPCPVHPPSPSHPHPHPLPTTYLCFLGLPPDTPEKSRSLHRTAPSSPRPCWRREHPWRASRLHGRGDVTGMSRADCRRDGVGEGGDQVGLGTLFYYGRLFESLLSFPLLSLFILRCCAGDCWVCRCALMTFISLTHSLTQSPHPSLTS
jgi:hypothetical protein